MGWIALGIMVVATLLIAAWANFPPKPPWGDNPPGSGGLGNG